MNTFVEPTAVNIHYKKTSAAKIRQLCLEEGADDAGFVEIGRAALAKDKASILKVYPKTQTLISLVKRMNPENIQSPARYVANNEFHHTIDDLTSIARRILEKLNSLGIRGVVPTVGFPMDMDRWGEFQIWDVSHKPIAVQAGLGQMGIHRNVIHPKFGNFVLLETILINDDLDEYGQPLDYNPCLTCNLCVAACPVGAVQSDGAFDFSACLNHNYREFMGGFQEWTETVASSKNRNDYRTRFRDSETLSMWQSLAFGPNYKAAYCMAVCPAGEDPYPEYQLNKKKYVAEILQPLKDKKEPVYVRPGTPAERAAKRNPNKEIRPITAPARPSSIKGFVKGLPLVFNPLKAGNVQATLQFHFSGREPGHAVVTVNQGKVLVNEGKTTGTANLEVWVDSDIWLGIVNRERSPFLAMLTGKLKFRGNPIWLRRLQDWTVI